MNETSVRNLMAEIASEMPAATGIDSYRAATTARRHRQWRQLSLIAGAAALVLVVTIAGVALFSGTTDRAAPVATFGPSWPTILAPAAFDPARTTVRAGWLPKGFDRWEQQLKPTGVFYRTKQDANTLPQIVVYLAARGQQVTGLDPVGAPRAVAGPLINGMKSTWYANSATPKGQPGRVGQLRFQWTAGGYGAVDVLDVKSPQEVAIRVATEFVVKLGVQVRFPFTFTRPALPLAELAVGRFDLGASGITFSYAGGLTVDIGSLSAAPLPTTKVLGPWKTNIHPYEGGNYYTVQIQPEALLTVGVKPPEPSTEKLAEQTVASFRMAGKLRDYSTWRY